MVVERCVTENSTEQSEEKAAKKDWFEITYKSCKISKQWFEYFHRLSSPPQGNEYELTQLIELVFLYKKIKLSRDSLSHNSPNQSYQH